MVSSGEELQACVNGVLSVSTRYYCHMLGRIRAMSFARRLWLGIAIVVLIIVVPPLVRSYRIATGDWKCYSEECNWGDFPEFSWHPRMLISDTVYAGMGSSPTAILLDYRFGFGFGDVITIRSLNGAKVSAYISK